MIPQHSTLVRFLASTEWRHRLSSRESFSFRFCIGRYQEKEPDEAGYYRGYCTVAKAMGGESVERRQDSLVYDYPNSTNMNMRMGMKQHHDHESHVA